MKRNVLIMMAVIFFISCKEIKKSEDTIVQKEDIKYTITGSGWNVFEGDVFQIAIQDTVPGGTKVIHEPIIKNGSFTITGDIKHPQYAYFGLFDQQGEFKYYKGDFILEHGIIKAVYDTLIESYDLKSRSHKVTGKYNDLILNDVRYKKERVAKLKALRIAQNEASEKYKISKNTDDTKAYFELNDAFNNYTKELYEDIRNNHKDPYARMLAIAKGLPLINPELELQKLEKEIGELTPQMTAIRYDYKNRMEIINNDKTVGVGKAIKDFTAKNLSGEEFHLADVLKKNKYTLVEFWASWCGPCRAEIPHMKEAYKLYNKKGFEIVSFTLDHKRESWVKASKEEQLPWIDTGDLLARKSPVVKMYGVNGIPANFLVDQTGKIIAQDLRGKKLDKKLEELLKN
ncbi:TlpA family protein disulfide reductase [Maribacter sp. 2304DJ31-5]|uniref:TlpA family protein disulfide reductase n=1 Tax=Maribacter sp. 2304DJ31-5 TaxID=3386273 RepID=UPI0039BD0E41